MSNSTYKKHAYERTVILALVSLAREHLLPPEGEDVPARRLECEELPRNESEVPEDVVIDVVMKLQRLARNRELEMSKYTHVLAESNDEQEWEEPKATAQASSKGAAAPAGKGKGASGGPRPKTSAAAGGGSKPAHSTNQQAAGASGQRT